MINMKDITQALETLLNTLEGYIVQRNGERNDDPSMVNRKGKGWIGIYRGTVDYEPGRCGGVGAQPWNAIIKPQVEVQAASMTSDADAEDKLEDYVSEVMTLLNNNKKIGGTVNNTVGYHIDYEYNRDKEIYWHAAAITLDLEVTA